MGQVGVVVNKVASIAIREERVRSGLLCHTRACKRRVVPVLRGW